MPDHKGVDPTLCNKECGSGHFANQPEAATTVERGETRLLPSLLGVRHTNEAAPKTPHSIVP